jgi:hypothetical protein
MGLDTKTYWVTDRQSQCDFDFDLVLSLVELENNSRCAGEDQQQFNREPSSQSAGVPREMLECGGWGRGPFGNSDEGTR